MNRLRAWLGYPWVYLKKKLDFQQQWHQFRKHIRQHRYKMLFFTCFITYPLYSPWLWPMLHSSNNKIKKYILSQIQPQKPAFKITDNFIKNIINSILTDVYIKQGALDFVNIIIQDQQFVSDILQLLLSGLKDTLFLTELSEGAQYIAKGLLNDNEIRKQGESLVIRVVSSAQVKSSLIRLVQQVFSSDESVETLVKLLQRGLKHEQVRQSLTDLLNYSVRQLLADEQTLNQLKVFIFFMLRKFENDQQIKGMMDILFAKGLGLVKKKKETQLDKLLKNNGKPTR